MRFNTEMFRSEQMSYLQILIPSEAAFAFVNELGRTQTMQFVDLNLSNIQSAFQRRYLREIIRINELETKLSSIVGYLDSHEISYDDMLTNDSIRSIGDDSREVLDLLENKIVDAYHSITQDIRVEEELTNDLKHALNYSLVLRHADQFLGRQQEARIALFDNKEADKQRQRMFLSNSLHDDVDTNPLLEFIVEKQQRNQNLRSSSVSASRFFSNRDVSFNWFAGVVEQQNKASFERQVFRVSRGNTYSVFVEVENEAKFTFILFFLGDQLLEKLGRLCRFMNVEICLTSQNSEDIQQLIKSSLDRENDLRLILSKTRSGLIRSLRSVSKYISEWHVMLLQTKSIFSVLNLFKESKRTNILTSEGQCPTKERYLVQKAIDKATSSKGIAPFVIHELSSNDHNARTPPTYFKTNKFTSIFQLMIDTYGVPRYKEINPALFTIITFPFLFALMYGDVVHGSCIALFATYLILFENRLGKRKLNEFVKAAYTGRYLLLLMGLFSIYCGFIYNEAISIPLHLYQTGQEYDKNDLAIQRPKVYLFGLDYAWFHTPSELSFFNSFKMKMSIIVGVTQMIFGLFLNLLNMLHFKDYLSIFCEFIPQLIFISSIFGYMVYLIFHKWTLNWSSSSIKLSPPSIIAVMIDMVLKPGSIDPKAQFFNSIRFQDYIEVFFLLMAVISVFWMLLPKPLYLLWQHRSSKYRYKLFPGFVYGRNRPSSNASISLKAIQSNDFDSSMPKIDVYDTENIKSTHNILSQKSPTLLDDELEYCDQLFQQQEEQLVEDQMQVGIKNGDIEPVSASVSVDVKSSNVDSSNRKMFRKGGKLKETQNQLNYARMDDEAKSCIDSSSVEVSTIDNSSKDDKEGIIDDFQFSETFIYQMIHTIEYVLGTVSNTASYLRLQALSLAHAELSKVIYEQIVLSAINSGSVIMILIAIPMFFGVTTFVLLVMDVLECFLHALRLHWVEFQTKFYKADGIAFVPFSYKRIISEAPSLSS